jgi:hypothetical protein
VLTFGEGEVGFEDFGAGVGFDFCFCWDCLRFSSFER